MATPPVRVSALQKIHTGNAVLDRIQDQLIAILNPLFRLGTTRIQGATVPVPTSVNAGQFLAYEAETNSFTYGSVTIPPTLDASTTVKGVTKLSVAPVSATNPIAVGDNDPRNSNARAPTGNLSTTSPITGGGALSAGLTIAHATFGTAGTYGSTTKIPQITTDATGHSSIVEVDAPHSGRTAYAPDSHDKILLKCNEATLTNLANSGALGGVFTHTAGSGTQDPLPATTGLFLPTLQFQVVQDGTKYTSDTTITAFQPTVFSIRAWIKMSYDTAGTNAVSVFLRESAAATPSNKSVWLWVDWASSKKLKVRVKPTGGASFDFSGNYVFSLDRWYQVGVVIDSAAGTGTLYVNGDVDTVNSHAPWTMDYGSAEPWALGFLTGEGAAFNSGKITWLVTSDIARPSTWFRDDWIAAQVS